MEYAGTRRFHEGTRFWDFLGGVFELLKHREALDAYVCPRCGRIEFFVDGIGDELRNEEPAEKPVVFDAGETTPPAAGPGRTCLGCGARSPHHFEVCWKCGAALTS